MKTKFWSKELALLDQATTSLNEFRLLVLHTIDCETFYWERKEKNSTNTSFYIAGKKAEQLAELVESLKKPIFTGITVRSLSRRG